jgi:hypothetical protein
MHKASGFGSECEARGKEWGTSIPRRPLGIGRSEPVLNHMAVFIDFNRTNTNRKAGDFSPAHLGIELAIGKYDA